LIFFIILVLLSVYWVETTFYEASIVAVGSWSAMRIVELIQKRLTNKK